MVVIFIRSEKVTDPFYTSKRWRRKRIAILKRDSFMCRESKRFGNTTPANTVHHIYPIELYPELAFQNWNLISMAGNVHNTFHDRTTNEIINGGKYWQKKFSKEFEKFYGTPPTL